MGPSSTCASAETVRKARKAQTLAPGSPNPAIASSSAVNKAANTRNLILILNFTRSTLIPEILALHHALCILNEVPCPLFMIPFTCCDLLCAIQLLKQHYPCQLMRESHRTHGQFLVRPGQEICPKPQTAPDYEYNP